MLHSNIDAKKLSWNISDEFFFKYSEFLGLVSEIIVLKYVKYLECSMQWNKCIMFKNKTNYRMLYNIFVI